MSAHKNTKVSLSLYHTGLAIMLAFTVSEAYAGEQLFIPLNNTWKAVQSENKIFGNTDIDEQEFIPSIEEDKSWTRRIIVKEMPGKKMSSDQYADEIQTEIEKSGQCTKSVTGEPIEKKHKGFEESVITFQCLQEDGSSKIFMSKTMESPSGLYEVRYLFLTDVNGMYSGKTLKKYLWEDVVEFMQLVQLCDSDTKDRACPLS